MKIAVSGSHLTGKTTLVEELCRALPDHLSMHEPYYHLEEEGHVFPGMPGVEDFELQVDEELHDIILRDIWDFNLEVLEVSGTISERLNQVLAHVKIL